MGDNKNRTIYQDLNKFLNINTISGNNNLTTGVNALPNSQSRKIIIKGNSPEEIYRKGLEIEQKQKLQDKFYRTSDRGFQKAMQYEAARLPAYIDYEGMEFYPLIASALDLFMEEATTIGSTGKMLNIYSNKERIKLVLEDFFYNIVNVNTNLPFWTRNVCKYGDNFVGLYGERKKGITSVRQLVNYEIERFERVQEGKMSIKFKERMTGDEFNTFEMAHFRLLGDDKMIPYGSSTLNKIRRVFRQLVLAEDAMLTYRLIRAGEKKVFKIDVGNIDEDDVEDYMYKVSEKFKRTPQIDQNNGQIDYRFNIMGVDEDYFIPVRNANVQTGIDTLAGATNLNDINDISYLRDNLFIGLGIPKPFLSFQDASGGGKNIAQFDIRFSKKVNRVQQAMVQELNKMAMIHLYYLGFEAEDLNNFALSLTNPSTQQELLKIELMQAKAQVYGDMTRAEAGIAAMSHTNAKRQILNMSDSEIVEDLRQQKMEKVIMQEFADAPVVIKKTGLFADIDKKYGVDSENISVSGATPTDSPMGGGGGGGGGLPSMGGSPSGGGGGGGLPPVGNEPPTGDELPPIGGEEGETPKPIAGLPNQSPSDLPPIKEGRKREMDENTYNNYVNKLVYGDNHKENTIKQETNKLIMETETNMLDLNSKALFLINEIENMVSIDSDLIQDVGEDDSDINLNELNLEDLN